jgi:glutathione S-transferase
VDSLAPAFAAEQHALVDALLKDTKRELERNNGPYIFGQHVCAFDTHIIVFLDRLSRVGKSELIQKAGLGDYQRKLYALKDWPEIGKFNSPI